MGCRSPREQIASYDRRRTARRDLPSPKTSSTYTFSDFVAAMAFVNKVADLAESANHHPDIDIRYNQVRLALISHDSGNPKPGFDTKKISSPSTTFHPSFRTFGS
jgi:pterin-4a-carbinolamine dehydratase